MKSKLLRTLAATLSVGALVTALVAANPTTTSAANLTGGNYTYVIDGEEVTFLFDPVVRKEGLLLPTEVFQHFGIKVQDAATKNPSVYTDSLTIKLTLGSTQADMGGTVRTVSTAPLRLNSRLFLPSDLLKEFGVEFSQDGTMVVMRELTDEPVALETQTPSEWDAYFTNRGFTANVKSDGNAYMVGKVALLNAAMINSTQFPITYGTRAKLHSLLQTNTLVLVDLSNTTNRSGGMQTAGAYLLDDQRNQYDLVQVFDLGQGLLNAKLAPGADRMGVLVYPKLAGTATSASIFYDANMAPLGTFPTIK
ncbi:MAG TPA: stalk domain-containing protein [Symbiobacteriaceae bacterium]|jgi:hypothetical protein|nr:stalk domain-containing protein [Symbiobacteriaceae bacterium]